MPRKTARTNPTTSQSVMDFGASTATAIRNPVAGHSGTIDQKAQEWGGFQSDILAYLSDIKSLEQFADMANNAGELADRLDPFLENAKEIFEAMEKLSRGQVTWTQLRQQYGTHVASAIAKIRKANSEFHADLEKIDAQDRSDMARIEQKRHHALTEIATQLSQDLQSELWRHEQKISGINNRQSVQQERQVVATNLREQRQGLLNRARYGSKGLGGSTLQEVIPVQVQATPDVSTVSVSGEQRGWWGSNLRNLWNNLGER